MEETELVYCEAIDSKKEVRQPQPPPLPKRREIISASFIDVQNLSRSISPLRLMPLTTNNCQRCRQNSSSKKQVVLSIAVTIFAIFSAVFMTLYFTTKAKCRLCDSKNRIIARNCIGSKLNTSNNTCRKKG